LLAAATQQAPEALELACCCNAASSGSFRACLLLQRSKLRSFFGFRAPELLRLRSFSGSGAPELACCCNAASSKSSGSCLLQRSKLRKLSGLLAVATQQALELLRSFSGSGACLLLQRSKLRKLLGLLAAATQQASELACCCNAASSGACFLGFFSSFLQ